MAFRKSINLGGGFRINLSKSGIGYSWGMKGARISKTAKGKVRGTVGIPGTGIYHTEEFGGKKKSISTNKAKKQNVSVDNGLVYENLDNVNISDYQPAEYKEFLDSINRVQFLNLLSIILMCTFALSSVPVFIFTGIVGVVLKILVHAKFSMKLNYEFDEEAMEKYNELMNTWMKLNHNHKFWQNVAAAKIDNSRANGGANRSVKRMEVSAVRKLPFYIKSNIEVFGLKLHKQKIYFLPDKLLVVSRTKVGALDYDFLNVDFSACRFIENERVPKDAKIVGETWLKVNNNGTPDKRFRDNRIVPICEYGKIIIESDNNLYVELMCSNMEILTEMKNRFEAIRDDIYND